MFPALPSKPWCSLYPILKAPGVEGHHRQLHRLCPTQPWGCYSHVNLCEWGWATLLHTLFNLAFLPFSTHLTGT